MGFFQIEFAEGTIPELNDSTPRNEALISKSIADLLGLKLGDSFYTYFLQDQMRVRKLKITGIYSTNFEEYDKMFVLTDIRIAQKLNGWEEDKYGGLEILISDFDKLEEVNSNVYDVCANKFDQNGNGYYIQTIKQINP